MKKLLGILVLGLLWCNYGNTEEPDLGIATFGFSCNPIYGRGNEKQYIGFLDVDDYFFRLGIPEEKNGFYLIEDTPLYFESVKDKYHSLKDIYIWYDLWVIEDKVMPMWFHNVFYYDEIKQKYFYSVTQFIIEKKDKKLSKAAKSNNKFRMMTATHKMTEEIVKKMYAGFKKNNKTIFKLLSDMYGSPISATKLIELVKVREGNLYICEEL